MQSEASTRRPKIRLAVLHNHLRHVPGQHLSELSEVEIFCNCALPKPDAMHLVTGKPLRWWNLKKIPPPPPCISRCQPRHTFGVTFSKNWVLTTLVLSVNASLNTLPSTLLITYKTI